MERQGDLASQVTTVRLPPEGVYAVEAEAAGQRLIGVTNVGRRPSDDDMPYVSVETLLVDFDGDLYGQELTLRFRSYLRPTRRFPGGLDQVRRQIRADAAEAVRRLTKS